MDSMIPAFFNPMNAMNMPIPADMAYRRFMGMLLSMISRIFRKVIRMNITPSTNIAVIAVCQEYPMPCTSVKAKNAFSAMLGACANGSLAIKARSRVAIAEARAVAVKTAPLSIPVVPRMDGFTARI